MQQPHPFAVPLQFGNEDQIRAYRRMEAVKQAADTLDLLGEDAIREGLKRLGMIEERDVFIG